MTTVEFKQQLLAAEAEMADLCRSYHPGSIMRINEIMSTIVKIRDNLVDAEKREAGLHTVQVLGLSGRVVAASDFEKSFAQGARPAFGFGAVAPSDAWRPISGLSLTVETNYDADATGYLKATDECFVHFANEEDACYVLGLAGFYLNVTHPQGCGGYSIGVTFIKPPRDAATRTLWRTIGALVARVKAIDIELAGLGAVRTKYSGGLVLSEEFVDTTRFTDDSGLPAMKRARATGASVGQDAYDLLRHRTPIDAVQRLKSIKVLDNEQVDCLIQLRELQIDAGCCYFRID
jgi:hypothetical protein